MTGLGGAGRAGRGAGAPDTQVPFRHLRGGCSAPSPMTTWLTWFVHDAWTGSQGANICRLPLLHARFGAATSTWSLSDVTSALRLLWLVLHMEGALQFTAGSAWSMESGWCLSRSASCTDCHFQPVGMPDAVGPCSHVGFHWCFCSLAVSVWSGNHLPANTSNGPVCMNIDTVSDLACFRISPPDLSRSRHLSHSDRLPGALIM